MTFGDRGILEPIDNDISIVAAEMVHVNSKEVLVNLL
jgi:hypothetical protein